MIFPIMPIRAMAGKAFDDCVTYKEEDNKMYMYWKSNSLLIRGLEIKYYISKVGVPRVEIRAVFGHIGGEKVYRMMGVNYINKEIGWKYG
jgi:hypothetical protein